jgi:hypothetical protein
VIQQAVLLEGASETLASSIVPILLVDDISVQNYELHPWEESVGVLGLSYSFSDTSSATAFQIMLSSATSGTNQIFGLDLRDVNDTVNSTMHLGGIPGQCDPDDNASLDAHKVWCLTTSYPNNS